MAARCPSCEYPLPDDRERVGARCPHCHDPLYEPAGRSGRPAREGEGACTVHAGVESVGACARCGAAVCEVCRTRWRNQVLCVACVNRALGAGEATPDQEREHARAARLALVLSGGAWALSGLAVLGAVLYVGQKGTVPVGLQFLLVLVVVGNVLVAGLGIGHGAAAVRSRGSSMVSATIGLALGGLYVGALLGAGVFYLWSQ
jgi:hypothetical protein